jgi:hypothetical protein
MIDLRELARLALEDKHRGEVAGQVVFLEALAKAVGAAGEFTSPGKISSSPRVTLLSDGRLSAERPLASLLAGRPTVLTLEVIAARLAAFAPMDAEVQAAALVVKPHAEPLRPARK